MKFMKPFCSAIAACLLAFILPASAYADLQEIVIDYCDEVDIAADEAGDELGEADRDLDDCYKEYNDCLGGIIEKDPVTCIGDYKQCIDQGKRDQKQACDSFLREFKSDTRRADRAADRQDVFFEWRNWFYGDTSVVDDPSSAECLALPLATSLRCANIVE